MTSFLRQAALWAIAGVAFNIAQRVLDAALDRAFSHVSWLAWLNL